MKEKERESEMEIKKVRRSAAIWMDRIKRNRFFFF